MEGELEERRKRVAASEDWSFFNRTPSQSATTAPSSAGGGWQLNPHQSKNDHKLNATTTTTTTTTPSLHVASAWDPVARPPSPPSPTHYSNPNLSPVRSSESPESDRSRQPSPFKVPRSPSRKRRKVSFAETGN